MGQITLQVPQSGQPNSTEDPKVASDMTTIQTWANGNVDSTNITAGLAQSACVNQSGQKVKGVSVVSSQQTVTPGGNYTTMGSPDQVTGIVLGANGLLRVWFWATWQELNAGSARAAIFVGSNQLKVQAGAIQATTAAATNSATPNVNLPLFSSPIGLLSGGYTGSPYGGDVTTGQALGSFGTGVGVVNAEVNGAVTAIPGLGTVTIAQPGSACDIHGLPAGTYTVSVQFKTMAGGTVTASNRTLRVQAISFS